MFHKHKWEESQRRTHSPVSSGRVSNISEELYRQMLYGCTIVTYVCSCGRRTQDTLLGKVEN